MAFISLLENKIGQRRLAKLVRTGGGLNKGSYYIWRHKEFSEFPFQMTHRWNLFDFKPLENPRKCVRSCIRGSFDPHGLVEGRKIGNVSSQATPQCSLVEIREILFPNASLVNGLLFWGCWRFKTARDHLVGPSPPRGDTWSPAATLERRVEPSLGGRGSSLEFSTETGRSPVGSA